MDFNDALNRLEPLGRVRFACYAVLGLGFADNLRALGLELGYTNGSAFSQLINGKVSIPRWFCRKFCSVYGFMSKEWMENGDGFPFVGAAGGVATRTIATDSTPDKTELLESYKRELEFTKTQLSRLTEVMMMMTGALASKD